MVWHADFATQVSVPEFAFGEVAFVDDVALMLHAPSNAMLEPALGQVADAFTRAARKRGLEVNWEPGKTEILWRPTGPGSKAIRQRLASNGAVMPCTIADQEVPLRIVDSYKHLGTWVQANGSHAKEVKARISAARSVWGALAKPFFRKRHVPSTTKSMVFQAISGSRHQYQVHAWVGVTDGELDTWADALRPMLASLARGPLQTLKAFHFSVTVIAGLAGILPPQDALHLARLRYLKRWLQQCPSALWTFLCEDDAPTSWLARCRQSLDWFRAHYPHATPVTASAPLLDCLTFVALDANWRGRLCQAALACRSFRRAHALHVCHQAEFDNEFLTTGAQLPQKTTTVTPAWQCQLCEQHFGSARALATHSYQRHGYKDVRMSGTLQLVHFVLPVVWNFMVDLVFPAIYEHKSNVSAPCRPATYRGRCPKMG